jgi:hypothetical protein
VVGWLLVCLFVCLFVGWLVGWLVGWVVGLWFRLGGCDHWLVGVGLLVGWLVGWLVGMGLCRSSFSYVLLNDRADNFSHESVCVRCRERYQDIKPLGVGEEDERYATTLTKQSVKSCQKKNDDFYRYGENKGYNFVPNAKGLSETLVPISYDPKDRRGNDMDKSPNVSPARSILKSNKVEH